MKRFIHTISSSLRYVAGHRRLRYSLLAVAGLFVVVNVVVFALYTGRTYPKTSVANQIIGSVSYDRLTTKIDSLHLLPEEVTFTQGDKKHKVAVSQLGVTVDANRQTEQLKAGRSWLPLANLLLGHSVPLSVTQQGADSQQELKAALNGFQSQPSDAKILRQDGAFSLQADKPGQAVDVAATKTRLLASLSADQSVVPVAVKPQTAAVSSTKLQPQLDDLKKQTKASVSLRYAGKTKKFSTAEISAWFTEADGTYSLADSAVQTAIRETGASLGIRVANLTTASQAVASAVRTGQAASVDLEAAPPGKRLTYCTAVRGVDASELPGLEAKLAETFRDIRGWGLEGLVQFDKVASGCDFTVWLTAADQMSSFGAICDPEWSCMVSPNVVINYDRWRNASSAWNNQGGNLQDYRAMVINHETGHWLGFYHSSCPGPGQQAPVMQQQSIDLQGCSFNPWPTAGEKAVLQRKFGL